MCSCCSTTAVFQQANASYQSTSPTSRPVAARVALDDLASRRQTDRLHPGVVDRLVVGRVGRIGPVVQQDAEIDERVAERGHVPVEDRLAPDRDRRGRTGSCRACSRCGAPTAAATRGSCSASRVADGVHQRLGVRRRGERPSASSIRRPGARRSPPDGRGPPSPQATGSSGVQLGEASTTAKPTRRPTSSWPCIEGGTAAPDHLAGPVLDEQEVRADHRVVLTEEEGSGRPVEVAPQPRQRLVLAAHVVRARGDRPERRTAEHDAPVTELAAGR